MEDKSINAGKVGLTMGGDWKSSESYEKLTCVSHNGRSWAAKKNVSAGIEPSEANSAFWQKMSERGIQGIQGPVGPQGNSAYVKDGEVNKFELVNNLTQGGEAAALSAEQGKVLKAELTELEPRISSVESAESILSANQQTIQTDIAAIENTANIVTISELTEDELVQQSSVRVICDRLIAAKRIVGSIITSVIDIAVQYMDINANILYDSGWVRQTEINTIGYTNAHTLRLIFRNQSASSISKTDVISHISKLSLKEYGSLLQLSDIVGEGNTEYYGKAITLNIMEEKKYCNNALLHTIHNREDITALTSIQSLAIHEGIAVIPKDGTRFVIMDIASGELLYHGEFPQSHHNNAIQFSNTFYDGADRFPLLLLSSGDYENPSNKAMVLRMRNDYTMTLIKEINCGLANVQYNGSFVADFSTNRLWLYTFTNGSYAVRENNNVVIYEFALPNIKTSESVTLSKDDILKEAILPICTMQDAVAYGGKLWFPCSYADYINGFPTNTEGMNDNIILVFNPNNGVIESAIKGVAGLEPQGIDFYNGKMYYTCKNSGVTEIGKTAFRFYEYSFNS